MNSAELLQLLESVLGMDYDPKSVIRQAMYDGDDTGGVLVLVVRDDDLQRDVEFTITSTNVRQLEEKEDA